MYQDTLIIVCSYLDLEDILGLTDKHDKLRQKILKLYPQEIPNMERAVKLNSPETIRYLISINAKIDSSVFYYAVKNDYLDILKSLEYYLPRFKSLYTLAILFGKLNIVKYLSSVLPYILELEEQNFKIAYTSAHLEICEYFWELGYGPSSSLLEKLCTNKHLEILKFLKSKDYIFIVDNLNIAVLNEADEVVKYLLTLNLDLKSETSYLRYAIETANLNIIKLLSKYCIYQYEHLQTAIYCKNLEIIDYLIVLGVKPKKFDYKLIAELRKNF